MDIIEDTESFLGNITSAHELQSKYNKSKSQPLGPIVPQGNNAPAPVPKPSRIPNSTELTTQHKMSHGQSHNKTGKNENVHQVSSSSTNNQQRLKSYGQQKYGTVLVGDSTNFSPYVVNGESDKSTRQMSDLSKNHMSTEPSVTTYTKIDMSGMISAALPNPAHAGDGGMLGDHGDHMLHAAEVHMDEYLAYSGTMHAI